MPADLQIAIQVDYLKTFSLAAQQNAYPLFKRICLHWPADDEELSGDTRTGVDLKLVLGTFSELFVDQEYLVQGMRPGESRVLPQQELKINTQKLSEITEIEKIQITFEVLSANDSDQKFGEETCAIDILPSDYWGGEQQQPDLIAAFVQPNGSYVKSLVNKAAELLEKVGEGRVIDGYQSNTRERPYLMASALWSIIFAEKLTYVSPPPSFAETGQRIRLPSTIGSERQTACLDSSVLFASCLESMGLNPVIALSKGHAFCGMWLIDESFPVLHSDDPMDLRKRIDGRDLVLFETTLVSNVQKVTFEESLAEGRRLIDENHEHEFVYVIDVKHARARKIRPLATFEQKLPEAESVESPEIDIPIAPPLPPVGKDDSVIEETPETRIDKWQRKLLDLTKRNALLSMKERALSVRIFCPDIGTMEDMLASGITFSFQAAEESPINDSERNTEMFRLQSGSNLHVDYAVEQLNRNILIANADRKRLDHCALQLLRKAKNDLEEGGSNTLFLALGVLKWKELPDDERSYKAPLILLPVQLIRKSARAPVKLKQLEDEEPIFNTTLIEFLQTEHEIDLNRFRDSLPEDDAGVDVHKVWSVVRDAVSEHKGFEVVEDLVLSSFSFAKYLMWKDLKDRLEDLTQNPFVKHLVDSPADVYQQDSHFIRHDQVDEMIAPQEIFTPLNCDSSQMVAVEASGRPQDFVLEGPPGTGKSETIANIICHNLALGRKVLFVAEKMAALNVVFRRMQKVGLDHLCLELHSNKANKKDVLEQLRRAADTGEAASNSDWKESARHLKNKRDALNHYVNALHEKSIYDISVREAIARDVGYGERHNLRLEWPEGFNTAPVTNSDELAAMLEAVRQASIAFNDVRDVDAHIFSAIKAKDWSNSWQRELIAALEEVETALRHAAERAKPLAEELDLKVSTPSLKSLETLVGLAELVEMANQHSMSYAFGRDLRDRLTSLSQLGDTKAELDKTLEEIGHGANAERLTDSPIETWMVKAEGAQGSWLKSFFARWSINRAAKKLGYQKFKDLRNVLLMRTAKTLIKAVEDLRRPFEDDKLWQGWETPAEELLAAHERGRHAHRVIGEALSFVDEPTKLTIKLKTNLVDGRDYLEQSKLMLNSKQLLQSHEALYGSLEKMQRLNVELSNTDEITRIADNLKALASQAPRIKSWTEWQRSAETIESYNLQALRHGLEARTILADDALEQVKTAFCRWLAPQLIDQKSVLRQFKSSSHEQLIQDFRELDHQVAETTSEYIAAEAANRKPDPFSTENKSEFGLLARELQKKTRHAPIRKLVDDMGTSLLDLCPCLMMSPLSVAQFLPSDFSGFDLVVFDEASQITTWDSVGAIARGKNVIVVGDPKQMPPTNFFAGRVQDDDADEEDLESILDQALAARLPHLRLKGHYRSRHETLIAFSNSKYYDNALVTYPSSDTKESAVTLRRVDGVYAKGKGRNNPIEAKAVVEEIVSRLKTSWHSESIGVVTLNSEQQRTIEDLLDEARRTHLDIEPFFHSSDDYDGVFVKNLESVQGDERDVIILSLGYGPTEPGGKTMSMNFGPLNKQGGERRLNVAVTRSKREVLVFSSFDSGMIDLSRTSAAAVEDLKHYLEFAERGPIALAEQATAAHGVDQFDSDFEHAVAASLRARGWKLQTQVGVSKFRIDLGVLHPDLPGNYLAGIECDGATYHGSPSARDRDRVRHLILEDLGWRLVRIWSTDYFLDPETVLNRVDQRLNQILQDDRERIALERSEEPEHKPNVFASEPSTPEFELEPSESWEGKDSSNRIGEESALRANDYFKPEHKARLQKAAEDILETKNGITFYELALDIANLHGLSRTSKKQLQHLHDIIKPWAGIRKFEGQKTVIWRRPDDVVDVMPWRGLEAFGEERTWKLIPYPEVRGLTQEALQQQPDDPVDYLCQAFDLQRRHGSTINAFQNWVEQETAEAGD